MMNRHQAREFILRALYQREFIDTPLSEMFSEENPGDQRDYIECVFSGIIANREKLDELLGKHTIGWRFERLSLIDRNILRLGAYELLYMRDEIPAEVAIDEAVELAKTYGTDHAQVFINGIMDRILKERE